MFEQICDANSGHCVHTANQHEFVKSYNISTKPHRYVGDVWLTMYMDMTVHNTHAADF